MFLNIKVDSIDQPYLRLFYRANPAEELKVYQFSVHAFGLTSSPCVAISCVKWHVKQNADKWPVAEEAICENAMLDDIWFMSYSKAELSVGMGEIKELMDSMGTKVHKWGSNCPELLEGIPLEKRAKMVELSDPDRQVIKTLGVVWDTEKDVFLFPKGPPILQPWTLRTMTSSAEQLFDPPGTISPTTLPAKLLIQCAWRYQEEWDEPVPEALGKKMSAYCENQAQLY